MSRSQLDQEKAALDSFVWVNEVTGEVTVPAGEESRAAEKRRRPEAAGPEPGQRPPGACPPRAAPASPPPPWALPCRLRNVLTRNNRFSF
ncbi:uncharacterized protein C3orf86-like [Meriones unguiculatus]|uniref:uncharacterized protein C3orf86-like n=1 Tax=Meriones unguiculatus TaxID=10047 RepID=UPI00293EDFCB|nr:uncharacterized protein C3orf86-like [Meriones unguiculatus]